MAANAQVWAYVDTDGFTEVRSSQWTIGTYTANGNQFGLVVPANRSRKRLVITPTPGTEGLWGATNKIYWSPVAARPITQGMVLLFPPRPFTATQNLAVVAAPANAINAPAGVGTYDIPALSGTIVTSSAEAPFSVPQTVIEHWTGPVYMYGGGGIYGADKSIDILELCYE